VKLPQLGAVAAGAHLLDKVCMHDGADAMRSGLAPGLALGLLFGLWTSADAAPAHRSERPRIHWRTHQGMPAAGHAPTNFAIPGWTDGQTQRWLDNASAGSGLG
jgi:hypothetical protein